MTSYVYFEGATLRLTTQDFPFTSISGTVVNPDVVTLQVSVQGQAGATYTWTNPTGDPSSTIVHDGTGIFHADLSTVARAGVWSVIWSGQPSSGLDSTKTSAVWQGEITVSPVGF
jgi:hypothetical protein